MMSHKTRAVIGNVWSVFVLLGTFALAGALLSSCTSSRDQQISIALNKLDDSIAHLDDSQFRKHMGELEQLNYDDKDLAESLEAKAELVDKNRNSHQILDGGLSVLELTHEQERPSTSQLHQSAAQSQHDKRVFLYSKALEIRQRHKDVDPESVILDEANLGQALLESGCPSEGASLLLQSWNGLESSPKLWNDLNAYALIGDRLATAYNRLDRTEDAEKLLDQLLPFCDGRAPEPCTNSETPNSSAPSSHHWKQTRPDLSLQQECLRVMVAICEKGGKLPETIDLQKRLIKTFEEEKRLEEQLDDGYSESTPEY